MYRKKIVALLAASILVACENDTIVPMEQNVNGKKASSSKVLKQVDSKALQLAELIHKTRDKGILEKLHEETAKTFDGDYDFLVADI